MRQKKEAEIEKQISYAKEHNNSHRVRGLETALAEVRAHCTEAGEIKKQQDSRDELANKIRDKQDDIRELREELAEDRAELKADIAEAERKAKSIRSPNISENWPRKRLKQPPRSVPKRLKYVH